MIRYALIRGTTALLIAVLLIPSSLILMPRRAVAADSGGGCVIGLAVGALGLVGKNATVSVPASDAPGGLGTLTTSGSSLATCLYNTIVVPILRQMIRNILKGITQATINWINGANSTGQPSYVPNLSIHLRLVADSATLRFLQSMASALQNPFGTVISRLSQRRYLLGSSLAGFYADNQCTLDVKWSDPTNPNNFFNGNFSQGGAAAWLSLTTQPQNNPYALYQRVTDQSLSNVNQAVTNRRQDLIQSGGILSFCPGDASTKISGQIGAGGINPQIACTSPDGKPVKATTPGSAISSYLNTNLGSGVGQLVSAQDLDAAIGAVVSALAQKVIGPGGLFAASQPNGGNGGNIPPLPGAGDTGAPATAQDAALAQANAALANVTTYSTAWQSIGTAAVNAQGAVNGLIDFCNSQAGTGVAQGGIDATVAQAQNALTNEIEPVIAQAQMAPIVVASSTAFVNKVKLEITGTTAPDPVQYATDVVSLTTLSPTLADAQAAQSSASTAGGASAQSAGSLTVSGGSLADQMNLIAGNAAALKTSCTAQGNNGGNGNNGGGGNGL